MGIVDFWRDVRNIKELKAELEGLREEAKWLRVQLKVARARPDHYEVATSVELTDMLPKLQDKLYEEFGPILKDEAMNMLFRAFDNMKERTPTFRADVSANLLDTASRKEDAMYYTATLHVPEMHATVTIL